MRFSADIRELRLLELVEDIEDYYLAAHGARPTNLSHWNTSDAFSKSVMPFLRYSSPKHLVDYVYPAEVGERRRVADKLGIDYNAGLFLTPSGTIATLCCMNWLRLHRVRRLIVITPSYWTVFHAAHLMRIPTARRYATHDGEEYRLSALRASRGDAVWICNPYYSTGKTIVTDDRKRLENLSDKGIYLIIDECLAVPGSEISREFEAHPLRICINSPHKAVSLNSFKFALISCHEAEQVSFESWGDVLFGGLGIGPVVAVRHFLSSIFDEYVKFFRVLMTDTAHELRRAVRNTDAVFDSETIGNFISVYFPQVEAGAGSSKRFMTWLAEQSGAVVIPNVRNFFNPKMGFSFRINLAAYDPHFLAAFVRISRALSGGHGRQPVLNHP